MTLTPAFCSIVVVSFAGLGLATHCYTYGAGLFSKLQGLLHEMQCSKPAAVQAAAWEMRSRNYLNFCQYLVHFAAISMLWSAWDTVRNPSYSKSWLLLQFIAAWTQHHACLEGWIPLDCRSLRTISIAQYGAFVTFHLGCLDNMQADAATALSFNTFQIVMRCLMALIFADTPVAIPGQFFLSLAETCIFLQCHGYDEAFFGFAVVQALTLGSTYMISGLSEFWINSQTEALLESKATVHSFRKMLRGLCDGEVVLDSDLRVCDGLDCLQRLLMVSSFDNDNFAELLVPEQLESFRSFLSAEENQDASMPACLRVSLRDPGSDWRSVDLFHVKMPHIGDEGQHLIALREDGDARKEREMREGSARSGERDSSVSSENVDLPAMPAMHAFYGSPYHQYSPSAMTLAPSTLPLCTELADMTLLVDASTPQLEIHQANLSFVRQPGEESTIPCLRSMVRPTDWDRVRGRLQHIASGASGVWCMSMHLQDGAARRYIRAEEVHVSSFSPPGEAKANSKLRMNFTGLRDETPGRPPSLGSLGSLERIKECGEDSDSGTD